MWVVISAIQSRTGNRVKFLLRLEGYEGGAAVAHEIPQTERVFLLDGRKTAGKSL